VAPGRSAPMGGRFARWNGQERAPNREPSQGSTDEMRTSLSRVRLEPVLNRGGLFGAQLPKPDLADVFLAHASHLRLVLLDRVPGVGRLG
jgi:hypothetical protein